MGYSNFKKLENVLKKFGLSEIRTNLFPNITPVTPSEWLLLSLEKAYIMPLLNEKGRSERLVSPLLLEVAETFQNEFSLFSGYDLVINATDDLTGPCDFFFAHHPPQDIAHAPIVTLVEAKDEDMDYGMAQCVAQMYAATQYNLAEGREISVIYGCATTGEMWQFMKLENNLVSASKKMYYINQPEIILGAFFLILRSYQGRNLST